VGAEPADGRLRVFLRTEAGSAAVLLSMAVAALAWVNISASSYEAVWGARLSVILAGGGGIAGPARVGQQRADDLLLLRLRPWRPAASSTWANCASGARLALPVAAGLGGLAIPVVIYLAVNAGGPGGSRLGRGHVHGLGVRRLGTLAPDRPPVPPTGWRAFLLSVAVVDDLVSLVVIGAAYSKAVVLAPLGHRGRDLRRDPAPAPGPDPGRDRLRGGGDRGVGCGPEVRRRPGGRRPVDGPADLRPTRRPGQTWSGASDLFRSFREQPTPGLAQVRRRAGLATALSPNERLQQLYHPWTSYVIVPLFALAKRRHPRSAQPSLPAPTPPPSRWASSSGTSRASRSASPARRGCSPA